MLSLPLTAAKWLPLLQHHIPGQGRGQGGAKGQALHLFSKRVCEISLTVSIYVSQARRVWRGRGVHCPLNKVGGGYWARG